MTENSEKADVPEFDPGYCKLVNQHSASYLSVMGNHTPGTNSDSIFLQKELNDKNPQSQFPRLLALVNDGVSGDREYLSLVPGKFAADFFSRELPKYWLEYSVRDKVRFSGLVLQHNFQAKSIRDVYCWLVQCIDKSSITIEPTIAKWIMLMNGDLLMRSKSKIPLEKLFGMSAQEIAKAILIDEDRLAASFRLLIALYHSTKTFGDFFQKEYGKREVKDQKTFYSATTTTGIVDLPNEYMLFSVGDSGGYIVDEFDLVDNSTTICPLDGKKTSAIGCNFLKGSKEVQLLFPANSRRVVDGVEQLVKSIAINFIEKKTLDGEDYALVLLTDGLMQTANWLRTTSNSVSSNIGNTRKALQIMYNRALKHDLEYKKSDPRYNPDDKTMVIIKKGLAQF